MVVVYILHFGSPDASVMFLIFYFDLLTTSSIFRKLTFISHLQWGIVFQLHMYVMMLWLLTCNKWNHKLIIYCYPIYISAILERLFLKLHVLLDVLLWGSSYTKSIFGFNSLCLLMVIIIQVQAEIKVIVDNDIPMAIVDYISNFNLRKIVMGSSSRNIITR